LNLGERLLEKRQALHVTQQDLAKSLEVTPQHISLLEQNKTAPSLMLLAGLATELGVSIDYLVTGKEGIITETIPAIKADKKLRLKSKKALIAMVEELYEATPSDGRSETTE